MRALFRAGTSKQQETPSRSERLFTLQTSVVSHLSLAKRIGVRDPQVRYAAPLNPIPAPSLPKGGTTCRQLGTVSKFPLQEYISWGSLTPWENPSQSA